MQWVNPSNSIIVLHDDGIQHSYQPEDLIPMPKSKDTRIVALDEAEIQAAAERLIDIAELEIVDVEGQRDGVGMMSDTDWAKVKKLAKRIINGEVE